MSGFWDTPLDSILRNLGRSKLLFAGVNADQCVLLTLQDAACLGYEIWRRYGDVSSSNALQFAAGVLVGSLGMALEVALPILVPLCVLLVHLGVRTVCEEYGEAD